MAGEEVEAPTALRRSASYMSVMNGGRNPQQLVSALHAEGVAPADSAPEHRTSAVPRQDFSQRSSASATRGEEAKLSSDGELDVIGDGHRILQSESAKVNSIRVPYYLSDDSQPRIDSLGKSQTGRKSSTASSLNTQLSMNDLIKAKIAEGSEKIKDADSHYFPPVPKMTKADLQQSVARAACLFGDNNFGSIKFVESESKVVWYVRIRESDLPDNAPFTHIGDRMVDFMMNCLGRPAPHTVLSVVGGVEPFEHLISNDLTAQLKQGLRQASEGSGAGAGGGGAWIITGGSDCGIMKIVGNAMADINYGLATHRHSTGLLEGADQAPVIGIASWRSIRQRYKLMETTRYVYNNGDGLEPPDDWPKHQQYSKLGLDVNHSIFFLIDDDSHYSSGNADNSSIYMEMKLRQKFVESIKHFTVRPSNGKADIVRLGPGTVTDVSYDFITEAKMQAVVLLLVVNGGAGTFKFVKNALDARTPVLLIEGSGRAADVLSYAWRFLHDASLKARQFTYSHLKQLIRNMLSRDELRTLPEYAEEALEAVLIEHMITIFTPDSAGDSKDGITMTTLMAESLINSQMLQHVNKTYATRDELAMLNDGVPPRSVGKYRREHRKLIIAMLFGQAKMAEKYICELVAMSRGALNREKNSLARKKFHGDLHRIFIWALLAQRTEFVALCSPYIDMHDFLYETSDETDDTLNVLLRPEHNKHASYYLDPLFQYAAAQEKLAVSKSGMFGWLNEKLSPVSSTTSDKSASGAFEMSPRRGLKGALPKGYMSRLANRLLLHVMIPQNARPQRLDFFGTSYPVDHKREHKARNDRAYQDLLMWACLCGYKRFAIMFWIQGGNSTAAAIFASTFLRRLARFPLLKLHGTFTRARQNASDLADTFESLAIGVVDECYSDNTELAETLLKQPMFHIHLPGYEQLRGFENCMTMAVRAKCLDFISHPAFLSVLEREWYAILDSSNEIQHILLAMFCPFLLSWRTVSNGLEERFLKLRISNQWFLNVPQFSESVLSTDTEHNQGMTVPPSSSKSSMVEGNTSTSGTFLVIENENMNISQVSFWSTVYFFYTAPIIKFFLSMASYICMIMVLLVVCVSDISDHKWLTVQEWIALIWFGSHFCDLIHSFRHFRYTKWRADYFNILDTVMIILFAIGVAYRSQMDADWQNYVTAKLFYCTAFVLLVLGSFRYCRYSAILGPKIMMLQKMAGDVTVFAILWAVFLLAYGGAVLGLSRPAEEHLGGVGPHGDWDGFLHIVRELFLIPMQQLFGEIFLEELQQQSTTCVGPAAFQSCTWQQDFIYMFAFIYMFGTTIVLVNLLIAMMSQTYADVQLLSHQLWNRGRFKLLEHFQIMPPLPPPFSILTYFFWIAQSQFREFQRRSKSKHKNPTEMMHTNPQGFRRRTQDASYPNNTVSSHRSSLELRGIFQASDFHGMQKEREVVRRIESYQEKACDRYAEKHLQSLDFNANLLNIVHRFENHSIDSVHELRVMAHRLESHVTRMQVEVREMERRIFGRIDALLQNSSDNELPNVKDGDTPICPTLNMLPSSGNYLRNILSVQYEAPMASSDSLSNYTFLQSVKDSPLDNEMVSTGINDGYLRKYPPSMFRSETFVDDWWRYMPREASDFDAMPKAVFRNINGNVEVRFALKSLKSPEGHLVQPKLTNESIEQEIASTPHSKFVTLFQGEYDLVYSQMEPKGQRRKVWKMMGESLMPDGSLVSRLFVPPDKKDWDIAWDDYKPLYYTDSSTLFVSKDSPKPGPADPEDVTKMSRDFNRSCIPSGFKLNSAGLPLHPNGRQGLAGRGTLWSWGPNHAHDQVVTRFKLDKSGTQITRYGRPMLEVLLRRRLDGRWALPGTLKPCPDKIVPTVRTYLGLDNYYNAEAPGALPDDKSIVEDLLLVERVLKKARTIFAGMAGDDRDTDNAWVETQLHHVHISGSVRDKFELVDDPHADEPIAWAVVHSKMRLYATHRIFIQGIVEKIGAFWDGP